jgi:hypothetical protein
MIRPIFRKEALERLASPDQLDRLLPLTSPRSWLALGGLGLLLLALLAWSVFGAIDTAVEGYGILLRRGGIRSVDAPATGVVSQFLVRAGEAVAEGQELAVLAPSGAANGQPIKVCSPFAAHVLERPAEAGAAVQKGASLLLLDPRDQALRVLVYVPVAEGYEIQPEMTVMVSPAPARKNEFGYLLGRVASAARFPATQHEIMRRLHQEDLARQLTAAGPCLEIIVELAPDPATPSGYRWSSSHGWPRELHSGTPCRALITIRQRRPIALVVPSLGDLLGS